MCTMINAAKRLKGVLAQTLDDEKGLKEDDPDTLVPEDDEENEGEGFSPS